MSNKKSEKHNLSAMLFVRRELSFDIRQSAVIKALNTYLISVMYQYLIIHTIIPPYMTFNIDRIVQRAIITQHTVDMIYHSFKVSHTQPVGTFMLAGFAFLVIILWTGIESREWSLYQGHSDRFGVIAAVQLDVCHNAAYKIFSTHAGLLILYSLQRILCPQREHRVTVFFSCGQVLILLRSRSL